VSATDNRTGFAEDYKQVFDDYQDTGTFKRDTLKKVNELATARYVAQLSRRHAFGYFGATGN
jgi:hypothetical protein